jgi:hypothetical protein
MKKRKRRDRQRLPKGNQKPSNGFRLRPSPFTGVDPEELKGALLAVAEREAEAFPKLLETMLNQLRGKYPPMLISIVVAYSLQAAVTEDGRYETLSSDVLQHHVEVMQALAMTLTREEWGSEPVIFADANAAMETLKALASGFHYRRFKALEKERDTQARAILSLQEKVRLYTQAVRNWGNFSQVIRISRELYAPLDAAIGAKMGFSASELILTADHMVDLLEERSSERMKLLRRLFREGKPRKIAQAYYRNYPHLQGDAGQFMKALPSGATRENVIAAILQHVDLSLQDIMTFTAESVAARTGLPHEVTERILTALGKEPGAFRDGNPEHFFMSNPVWDFPVINLDGKHFCPMPQAIFSHIFRIMHRVADEAGLLSELADRRSRYLEAKVAELLTKTFPSATLRNGTKWQAGAVQYETDHMLLVDKVVLIVEDKSAALTGRGLRGAPERVREHVKDLIEAPSEQSARLEAAVWRAKAGDIEAVTALATFGVDFSKIELIIRINVTLDDLTQLASEEDELKAAGWIRADLDLAPTMTPADLETVIDILAGPAFLLHYLAERQRVQTEGRVFADEIDLLGVYLDIGLNMGDLKAQNLDLALLGSSEPIDNYCNATDAGVTVPKPRPKLSPYYAKLVSAIEQKAPPGWTMVATDVLRSAVFDEQFRIEEALGQLKAKVEANWMDSKHECCLVIRSHVLRDTAVVFFAYPPQLAHKRNELAKEMSAKILDDGEVKRCVMILRDTSNWDEPYRAVMIAENRRKPAGENGAAVVPGTATPPKASDSARG